MSSLPPGSEEHVRLTARFGRRFVLGEVLFKDGDPATEALLLQEGRVRLIKRVGGMERSLRLVRPGDLFGESALIPGSQRGATAVALSDGAVLALDAATFQQVLASNPAVGARVLQQLVRRLRDAEDQIEILMLRDPQAKIVVGLLKLAQQALAASGDAGNSTTLSVSPIELAARVGLDVDVVKRSVQLLRDQDYVRVIDEKVEVLDLEALRELYGLLGVKQRLSGDAATAPR
jgi:CRP/FNR family transcriptional regulator, cyclic AMP receptor protein